MEKVGGQHYTVILAIASIIIYGSIYPLKRITNWNQILMRRTISVMYAVTRTLFTSTFKHNPFPLGCHVLYFNTSTTWYACLVVIKCQVIYEGKEIVCVWWSDRGREVYDKRNQYFRLDCIIWKAMRDAKLWKRHGHYYTKNKRYTKIDVTVDR